MINLGNIQRPDGLDWKAWAERWDRMQESYLIKRSERFETICWLIQKTQTSRARVLDLGCGTGSLMLAVLQALPEAEAWGIDFNPTLMWLAESQMKIFGIRAHLVSTDLRHNSWTETVSGHFDAVISATALHWLNASQISILYNQISQILQPAGIFLNTDHVGSDSPVIQKCWEEHRQKVRSEIHSDSDEWHSFWTGYSEALGLDTLEIHDRIAAGYDQGVEEGLPLSWHFDRLREFGFENVDCFWRCESDAIYGGIRK